ncbi:MAG TPA: pro-sigmaK processing inhibitor BofA [Clostridiaceae bacterium]|nr:pro-sigmaK processing inhibitor BofA [Clostridiaceae bacterium]
MPVSINVVVAYVVGIIFLFILGRFLLFPLKVILKLVYNALLGAVVLLLINLVGGLFGFRIALNFFSAFIAGVLGIPGIALLIILKLIFKV